MLPREWVAAFGRPTFLVADATKPATMIIPADDDRYLLAFWLANAAFQIRPNGVDNLFPGVGMFTNGDPPLIFTHALHGALVNLGFTLTSIAGPALMLVVTAQAPPQGKRRGRPDLPVPRPQANRSSR